MKSVFIILIILSFVLFVWGILGMHHVKKHPSVNTNNIVLITFNVPVGGGGSSD